MHKMVVVLLALALAACASHLPVSLDFDPAADFSHLRSFAWAPEATLPSNNSVVDSDTLLHQRLQNAITGTLLFKGFRLETDATRQPDFWVAYQVALTRKQDVIVHSTYYGYGYGLGWGGYYGAFPMGAWTGPEAMVREYDQRTLVLDILDPKTRKLIWRARTQDRSEDYASPQDRSGQIAVTVQQMLEGFPPLPKPR